MTKTRERIVNGLHIEFSNVNRAWFLMWNDTVLRIFNEKAIAEMEMEDLLADGYGYLGADKVPTGSEPGITVDPNREDRKIFPDESRRTFYQ